MARAKVTQAKFDEARDQAYLEATFNDKPSTTEIKDDFGGGITTQPKGESTSFEFKIKNADSGVFSKGTMEVIRN